MLALLLLLSVPPPPATAAENTERAWSVLTEGLENKDASKRAKAVHSLALSVNSTRAETLAEKALADTNIDVRVEGAASLGHFSSPRARSALHKALEDPAVKVVIAAANALYQLKDPAAYEIFYALLTGERKTGSGLVQSQLNTLRDRKQVEHLAFEAGVGFVPFGGLGMEAWRTLTRDDASAVRAVAAEALGHDPDSKSADALVTFAADKKWRVRDAVIHAICMRHNPALLPAVVSLLGDENDHVRYDAAAAVIQLSGLHKAPPKRAIIPPSANAQ